MMKREYYAGLLMVLIGLATVLGSLQYTIGTLERMGPGFFPLLLGAILALLGMAIAAAPEAATEEDASAVSGDHAAKIARGRLRQRIRPWVAVLAGASLFILTGTHGGLVPATFLLIFVSALGDRRNPLRVCLLLALCTTIVASAVFYFGLHLQFPLFAWA